MTVQLRIRLPYASDEEFVEKYGTNVARGGIFIATRSLKPEGTTLMFELVLADGTRLMRGEGVVVKAQLDDVGARSGMTVRFSRLDPPSKALVDRVIAGRSDGEERRRRRATLDQALSATTASAQPAPQIEESVLGIDLGGRSARAAVFSQGAPRMLPLAVPAEGPDRFAALAEAARAETGRAPGRAVLSVPAHFDHNQRMALLGAAQSAGLEVLRIVNATSAAALSFGFGRGLARKRVLVYDLGPGGFDASIVEITGDDLEVVATGGDARLAARDTGDEVTPEQVERTLQITRGVLAAANLGAQSLDEVLLVGEAGRSSQARQRLEQTLGRSACTDVEPETSGALGAALLGHSLLRQAEGRSGARVSEILTLPLGIALEGGAIRRVMERQTRLPAVKSLTLPIRAGRPLTVPAFQGDSSRAEENALLGALRLVADRDGEVELQFRVSENGTLEASARAPGGRAPVQLESADWAEALTHAPGGEAPGEPSPGDGFLGGLRRIFGGR